MKDSDTAPATSERPTLDLRPRKPAKRAHKPTPTEYSIIPSRASTLEMPADMASELRALSRIE